MRSLIRVRSLIFILTLFAQPSRAQDAAPAPQAEPADYFSGSVVSCSATQITVNRKGLARDSVTRTFVIDEDTVVEGTPKPKLHVTVQFITRENVLRAVHIIVR